MMDGFTFGLMVGQRNRIAEMEQEIYALRLELQEYERSLEHANFNTRVADGAITRLKLRLAIAEANAAGLATQVSALLKQHPDTPLLNASSRPWQSKQGHKTLVRQIYEQAFDAAARKFGIANPSSHRTN